MRSLSPCPIFPYDLQAANAKSLALLFILQELLSQLFLVEESKKLKPPKSLVDILARLEQFLFLTLPSPFTKKGGGIDKLCFYCETLLQASKIDSDLPLTTLDKMRKEILEIKTLISRMQKEGISELCTQTLGKLYKTLMEQFSIFFKSLFPFFEESKTNENLLLFLVEHQSHWDNYLGEKTVISLFRHLFPSGPCELRAAICEGYTRRGFASFYATKESLVDAIEWDSASCTI
jgi:hypothetical protein